MSGTYAQLLLRNAGMEFDLAQLEALIQAQQRQREVEQQQQELQRQLLRAMVTPSVVRAAQDSCPNNHSNSNTNRSTTTSPNANSNSHSSSSTAAASSSSARAPSGLATAAPVTSVEELFKLPISTKLNNLKLPKFNPDAHSKSNLKESSSQSADSNLQVFPSDYLPHEYDVVVDMAHYPNREFKTLIRQSLPNYTAGNQRKRKALVASLLQSVADQGGHFIRFSSAQQVWTEVHRVHAQKFTALALQNAASQRQQGILEQGIPVTISTNNKRHNSSITTKLATTFTSKETTPATTTTTTTTSPPVRRVSRSDRTSVSSCSSNNTTTPPPPVLHEIPIVVRKRRSHTVPTTTTDLDDRSALLVKFKRPRRALRKVSLEERQNPLQFLSQIAQLDAGSEEDEEEQR